MRWFWWVLIVLGLGLIVAYFYIRLAIKKVTVDFRVKSVDWKGITLSDILKSKRADVGLTLSISVINENNYSIPVRDLQVEIYQNNALIAESAPMYEEKIVIPAMGAAEFDETIIVTVDRSTLGLLKSIFQGKSFAIDYKVKFKVFGFPVSFKDTYLGLTQ